MPSLSQRAVDRLLAFLVACAVMMGGGAARAQTDPFALPENQTVRAVQTTAGPGLSEIEVDGKPLARLVDLQGGGQALTIDADNARAAGLPVPPEATGQIPLNSLKLYSWDFDPLRQRLTVKLFRLNDGANFHDLAPVEQVDTARRTVAAIRVDYDLAATAGLGGLRASGIVGAAAVKGDFVAATRMQVNAGAAAPPALIRLDSFVQTRLAGSNAFVTAGDFISAGTRSQRAVRMGGVQLTSDFSTKPDLITTPLPEFGGAVAVPTNLDILVADRRFNLGELEPGEFTVQNVPINPGRGSMAVLLKDSLGREVRQTVSFYTSKSLLRPDLSAYAVNVGFVRRRYGIESSNYGPLVASAYYRRGLSPFLTLEASGESTGGLLNFGGRADFTLGNLALASWELRGSDEDGAGSGYLVNGSIESIGRRLSARTGFSYPSARYRDVASHLGDRAPPKQIFANVSFDLARVPVQLSYVRRDYRRDFDRNMAESRSEVLSASLFHAPSNRVNFSLVGGVKAAQTRSFFVNFGISVRLGRSNSVNASAGREQGRNSGGVSYLYNDLQDQGFRAQASLGSINDTARIAASADYESRFTNLQGTVVAAGGQVAGQVTATGSLIAAGESVYARSRSNNGYVLVRAGRVSGIPVKLENRYVGKTDSSGMLLVQNLRTYVPQQIDVDASQLPVDAIVRNSRNVITVPGRAIGLVDIAAHYYRPVVRTIVGIDGTPLQAGSQVTAAPSAERTLVGYDGMVEINAASGDRRLLIEGFAGNCVVDLPAEQDLRASGDPLVCRPTGRIVSRPDHEGVSLAGGDGPGEVAPRN